MSPEQVAYLDRRRRQLRYWPWLAVLMLLVVVGVFGAIWLKTPLQLNPLAILAYFRSGVLPDTELVVLAARGSLALIACGLLLLVILLLIALSVDNERRLIAIIDQLSRHDVAAESLEMSIPATCAVEPGEALPLGDAVAGGRAADDGQDRS